MKSDKLFVLLYRQSNPWSPGVHVVSSHDILFGPVMLMSGMWDGQSELLHSFHVGKLDLVDTLSHSL